MDLYPNLTRDDARKWLGRYGTSGGPQLQRMALLSEGQKAKVVFAKMAKENAHLLLLDEPTSGLDPGPPRTDAVRDPQGIVQL